MTKTLRIEVTEALCRAACDDYDNGRDGDDFAEVNAMRLALTAAFQHPEFVRQIREQVLACVPEHQYGVLLENSWLGFRANLAGLLGVENG